MRSTERLARLLLIILLVAGVIIGFKVLPISSILLVISQVPLHLLVLTVIGLLIFLTIKASIKIIGSGYTGILERLGCFQHVLDPGVHLVIPFLDTVLVETTREQLLDIPPQSAITRDNVTFQVDAVLFWRILDVEKAYYAIDNLEEGLRNLVLTTLRSEIGKMRLKQIFSSRDEIDQALLKQLDQVIELWGVEVVRVEVREISFSDELRWALEAEQAAQVEHQTKLFQAQGVVETVRLIRDEIGADGETVLQYLLAQDYLKCCMEIAESESSKVLFMDPKYLNESVICQLINFKQKAP